MANTVGTKNKAGNSTLPGCWLNCTRPSAMMLPQVGTSGGKPSPKKLKIASVSTAEAATNVPCTNKGAMALGRMCRHKITDVGVAKARAAST